MTTNRQRQAAFKARQRAAGKKLIAVWATPEQEQAIKRYLAGIPLPVTKPSPEPEPPRPQPSPPPAEPTKPTQRKLTKLDPDTLPIPPSQHAGVTTAYQVLEDGERIGLVWKGMTGWYAKRARKASMLDALSNPRPYRTRERAVAAL